MARIIRMDSYYPYMDAPVYTWIEPSNHQNHTVGEVYEVQIEDEDRADGVYNSAHEAELIAERVMPWRDVPPMHIAYQGFDRSKDAAIERICAGGEEYDGDREVSLLVFLRRDRVEDLVTGEADIIPGDFTKGNLESQ